MSERNGTKTLRLEISGAPLHACFVMVLQRLTVLFARTIYLSSQKVDVILNALILPHFTQKISLSSKTINGLYQSVFLAAL